MWEQESWEQMGVCSLDGSHPWPSRTSVCLLGTAPEFDPQAHMVERENFILSSGKEGSPKLSSHLHVCTVAYMCEHMCLPALFLSPRHAHKTNSVSNAETPRWACSLCCLSIPNEPCVGWQRDSLPDGESGNMVPGGTMAESICSCLVRPGWDTVAVSWFLFISSDRDFDTSTWDSPSG